MGIYAVRYYGRCLKVQGQMGLVCRNLHPEFWGLCVYGANGCLRGSFNGKAFGC